MTAVDASPADRDPLQPLLDELAVPASDVEEADRRGPAARAALVATRAVLPAQPCLTPRQVWEQAGVEEERAKALWRAMGFPDLDDEVASLTDADLEALRTTAALTAGGLIADDVILQLARVMSQSMATISAALVDVIGGAIPNSPDPAEALAAALRVARAALPLADDLVIYLFRRHLANANERAVFRTFGTPEGSPSLAVGFADLVDFTGSTRTIDDDDLALLVERFAAVASGIVATQGGRVVKMIGDEVMFVTERPAAAAEIALSLTERVEEAGIGSLRAAVTLGSVLLAQGDLFGATVNLAARLVTAARPGTVLVDDALAERLDGSYMTKPVPARKLKGVGHVQPLVLRRSDPSEQRQ
jgi:adenylate cyclase